MKYVPPPDNLPIEPLDTAHLAHAGRRHVFDLRQLPALQAAVAGLSFNAAEIENLRHTLAIDVPEGARLNDDAIRSMAHETLECIVALFTVARSRLDRGAPLA